MADPHQSTLRAEIWPLLKLSIPLIVSLGAAILIGVIDTIMISPLGTVPIAAAGVTTAVLIILISTLWGVVTVISVQISQAEGARDARRVSQVLRSGLILCLLAGTLAATIMIAVYPLLGWLGQPEEVLEVLLPYWLAMALWMIPFTLFFGVKALFDAVNWPWVAVGFSYLAVVVNLPANYTFIHVLDLGILGAGLASILSQSAALALALLLLWRAKDLQKYRQKVRLRRRDLKRQSRESLPLCLGYAGEGGAYAIVGLMVGWLGAEALAAQQIVNAYAGLAYIIPLGMAGAVSIQIGQAVGGAQRDRLRPILKASLAIVSIWQVGAAATFILAGRGIAEAMSVDPVVIETAVALFIVVAALQVADGVQGTALGALRGMSDMSAPTRITLIAYWPVALPIAYLLGFVLDFGAVGIWSGYVAGLFLAAILLAFRFSRLTAPGAIKPHAGPKAQRGPLISGQD